MGEFAWHFEKMKQSDVKGIEREVEREGKLKNEDIDPSRSHLNKELVDNPGGMTLYQRVKKRVDVVRENGNRVQKNSVNLLSSVITFPKEDNSDKTEEEQELYFKICLAYFQKKFGKENVVSAIIHKDESRPHMHLQQVPVTSDNRLAARDVMKKSDVNQIHDELPKYLRHYGFTVQRGSGKTENNVKNIHAYKDIKKREEEIAKEQVRLKNLENQIRSSNAAELKRKEKELKEQQEIELAKKEKEMLARVKKEHNKVENYYTDVKNYHSRINKALEQAKGYMDDVGQFIDQQSSNIFEENREVLKLEIEMGRNELSDIYKKEVSDKAKDKFDTEVNDEALQVKNAIDDTQASQPVKPKMDDVSEIMLLLEKSSPGSVTGIVDSQKTQQVSYGERVNEIDSSLF